MIKPVTTVHIGDLHLGPNARNADRLRALDQIIAEAETMPTLGAWLLPGDLNHARMTIDDRNALAERLVRMADRAPVLICYGNHDQPGDLDVFARLKAKWPIKVYAQPVIDDVMLATCERATVFVLPYPTEAGLVSMGVAPGGLVRTAREILDVLFLHAGAQFAAARAEGRVAFAIGHVNVAGSITSVGQPNIGAEIEVDAAILARLDGAYVGLNHIHKGQCVGGAWYPGSVCRLDWGEIEPKRYLTVHHQHPEKFIVQEHEIDVAPMYHVEGHLYRDRFDWRVTAGPDGDTLEPPASWRGAEVRVRARFYQSEKALLEMARAQIFANFAEARRFELELIAVPDRALRAPEVAAAKTLAEKVAAWASATGLSTALEATAPMVAQLEHGEPDAVVATVQRRAEALVSGEAPAESEVAVA